MAMIDTTTRAQQPSMSGEKKKEKKKKEKISHTSQNLQGII